MLQQGFQDLADAFQSSYWVAFGVLVVDADPGVLPPAQA